MSKTSVVFNSVPVKAPKRSGFDMSHENIFSATVGTLIPASVEEVMPGDVVSMGSAFSVELPPLATDFKGRVDARLEAFFVPNRIVWAGFKDFICQSSGHTTDVPGFTIPDSIPTVAVTSSMASAGTLSDYLGIKTSGSTASPFSTTSVNALPYLAYWKIWDEWYRDSRIQKPFFVDGVTTTGGQYAAAAPYCMTGIDYSASTGNYYANGSMLGYNGKRLVDLAQRNYAKDYYTTMSTKPQAGDPAELRFAVSGAVTGETAVAGTGTFSIRSLRAANALQTWLERNNIGGTRYYDQILAHYGVLPSDAAFQRPVLLGSVTTPVICNSVVQQATNTVTGSTLTQNGKNPYANATGAKFGNAQAFGSDSLIDHFEVKEHGFVFVLFSLVPHAYYGTGVRRYLLRRKQSGDWCFPEFAGIGDQEVYKSELTSAVAGNIVLDVPLGYAQRFSEYKFHDDEVHGIVRDGGTLDAFVLQRTFDSGVTLGSELIEIPTTALDEQMVVTNKISGFNCIVDCYFDAKYLRPLPQYSLPSLVPDAVLDGKTVKVPKGGIRL